MASHLSGAFSGVNPGVIVTCPEGHDYLGKVFPYKVILSMEADTTFMKIFENVDRIVFVAHERWSKAQ